MTDKIINSPTDNRPTNFTEVIGQPFAQGVGMMIGKGNISGQGYILAGPKGCGKTTVARIIAKSLNCENRNKETGDPCNKCNSCLSIDTSTNPLVKEINAASKRGINEIRDAIQSMNYAINKGYRIYILDEMHMLTKEAFSVLLKPMEEPPEHVVFIATTTNPESILDTIISRVPIIPIKPLSDEELKIVLENTVEKGIASGIEEWNNVTEADIKAAIMSAQGSARQAITNLSGIVFHGISSGSTLSDSDRIIEAFRKNSLPAVLSTSTHALSNKENDPIVVISQVINGLVNDIKNGNTDNPTRTAYHIAELSRVSQDIRQSSQPTIIAARMAACITSKEFDEPNNMKKDKSKLYNVSNASIDDIIEIMFSSSVRKKLSPWINILDDETKSDINIKNGTLIISMDDPDDSLLAVLSNIFDSVKIVKR